ncbi:poly(ADP-ribose) glycohydrolase-like isoform X2 [Babylonia areolata]|uniref:poly(ADP-ribose) glycohydrolase-like isoform X2 n=1 Tax=Babylonia areolata TaxID=304850 RepID=UPI003FCF98C7
MIRVVCSKYSCCHQYNLICVNVTMSGSGTKKKGKQLIQSKLSFTSTPSAGSSGKLPKCGATSQAADKEAKRKADDMDPDMRKKMLEAAEKRQKHQDDVRSDTGSGESPYFTDKNSDKDGQTAQTTGASTSAEGRPGDTQQYDMADLSGSQDLFAHSDSDVDLTDSQNSAMDEDEDPSQYKKPSTWDANQPWKGKALDKLNAAPACLPPGLKLEKSDHHDICIKLPFTYSKTALPVPYPSSYKDAWDEHHVRMPCSNQNQYPVNEGSSGSSVRLERRWNLICTALKGTITCSADLEKAVHSYNQRYVGKWKFTVLHHYFHRYLKPADCQHFFDHVLPQMVRLALKLPHLCTQPLPLLKKGMAHSVTLSQQQAACLLANAFFCTFPRRNSRARTAEFASYPDINFNSLFQGNPISRKMEKLNCIIHYFKRVCYDMPKGVVTFSRQVQAGSYSWLHSSESLTDLHVSSAGTIEDNGTGMLQVDFANKYLGGGVLNTGCVQEEIRFMICPEMILSRLFTEVLGDTESLLMTGCEQFSEYEGYADSFKWKKDYVDPTQRDSLGRLCCEVVAIDALVFHNNYCRQFQKGSVLRELNKAYSGFQTSANRQHRAAVCTGNWGCGAFGGDKQIKSLIQMMAASAAQRDMCYFTFDDQQLTTDLHRVHQTLRTEEKTIGDIMKLLEDYNSQVVKPAFRRPSLTLFDFIHMKLEGGPSSPSPSSIPMADYDEDSNEARGMAGGQRSAGDRSPNYKADTP